MDNDLTTLFLVTDMDRWEDCFWTAGSSVVRVAYGAMDFTFYASDGSTAEVTLGDGYTLTFDHDTFTLIAPDTNPDVVVVLVDGEEYVLAPGDEVTLGGSTPGSITGVVTADCPDPITLLQGVEVDLYSADGGLVSSFVTEADGLYGFAELEPGDYTVTVVQPLGMTIAAEDVAVTIAGGDAVTVDFALTCLDIEPNQRGQGFWKHQVGVALGGNGHAHIDAATLCSYLELIEDHFNSNAINQVVIYDPPAGADCPAKLGIAGDLLNLRGNVATIERARQHTMALLLNVAGGLLGLTEVISEDGATVSQAITYCDWLIDDSEGDHDTAKDIADDINDGIMVAAEVIPLDIEYIAYRPEGSQSIPRGPQLTQNMPNPFNPATKIAYAVPSDAVVRLAIHDVRGARVAMLIDELVSAGYHEVIWAGTDDHGRRVPSGTYFCRMESGAFNETIRMTLVK